MTGFDLGVAAHREVKWEVQMQVEGRTWSQALHQVRIAVWAGVRRRVEDRVWYQMAERVWDVSGYDYDGYDYDGYDYDGFEYDEL